MENKHRWLLPTAEGQVQGHALEEARWIEREGAPYSRETGGKGYSL
jgi:hypothetical protein